jgi:hypothetical protein
MARKALVRILVAVVAVAALGFLFLKTVRDTNAEPYVVDAAELSGWTLELEQAGSGATAALVLRPPVPLTGDVFQQIFHRTGVSLSGPTRPGMPIVLESEYAAALKDVVPRDDLLKMARDAGLEKEMLVPVCMGITQDPSTGRPSQRFFLVFQSPAFASLRRELARLHEARRAAGVFNPEALPPIVPVASFEADFGRWALLGLDPDRDCKAGLVARTP